MGIINAISEWRNASYEKKISKMRALGTCPDCRGKGFDPLMFNEFATFNYDDYKCPGCEGSGQFSSWEAQQALE